MKEAKMTYVGIDVAKAKLDVAIKTGETVCYTSVENNAQGFAKLAQGLAKYPRAELHICLEATNTYSFGCAEFLCQQGLRVSIVNPALVKAYAESELRRNKTDKLDACLIANFCAEKSPRAWTAPREKQQAFQALYRRWETLKAMRGQELNRLDSERCQAVRDSLTSVISHLDEQIVALEASLDVFVEHQPELQHRFDLLISIPGVGKVTAYLLLAEIDFQIFTCSNDLVAFAGLNPRHNTSGTFKGRTTISKKGSSRLRKALYFPAIAAQQHNPLIRPLCLRLQSQGKHQLFILCAAMRKLLHLAFGVIKSNTPFDPHYLDKQLKTS
jgi:transposase